MPEPMRTWDSFRCLPLEMEKQIQRREGGSSRDRPGPQRSPARALGQLPLAPGTIPGTGAVASPACSSTERQPRALSPGSKRNRDVHTQSVRRPSRGQWSPHPGPEQPASCPGHKPIQDPDSESLPPGRPTCPSVPQGAYKIHSEMRRWVCTSKLPRGACGNSPAVGATSRGPRSGIRGPPLWPRLARGGLGAQGARRPAAPKQTPPAANVLAALFTSSFIGCPRTAGTLLGWNKTKRGGCGGIGTTPAL